MATQMILADRQDITKAGLMYICSQMEESGLVCRSAEDKTELVESL